MSEGSVSNLFFVKDYKVFTPKVECGLLPGVVSEKVIRELTPEILILNVTNECGSYCRFCQRKRNIENSPRPASISDLEQSIQYIRKNTEIRDV